MVKHKKSIENDIDRYTAEIKTKTEGKKRLEKMMKEAESYIPQQMIIMV